LNGQRPRRGGRSILRGPGSKDRSGQEEPEGDTERTMRNDLLPIQADLRVVRLQPDTPIGP
jgi:hypothetical protein